MQSSGIIKILQIVMVCIYPLMAVGIWFIPMFRGTETYFKVALSVVFVLYAALRVYKLVAMYKRDNS